MKTGQHQIHMSRIPADEPTFTLRAQDRHAALTIPSAPP